MEDRENKVAAAALLILAGGIVGAGLALLFAPQTGQRTRKDIARYARKSKTRAECVTPAEVEAMKQRGLSVEEIDSHLPCPAEGTPPKADAEVEK